MRLSDMAGKEVINVFDGTRMGVFGDADLLLEIETGRIRQLYLSSGGVRRRRNAHAVSWSDVVRIGPDLVVINSRTDEPKAPPEGKAKAR